MLRDCDVKETLSSLDPPLDILSNHCEKSNEPGGLVLLDHDGIEQNDMAEVGVYRCDVVRPHRNTKEGGEVLAQRRSLRVWLRHLRVRSRGLCCYCTETYLQTNTQQHQPTM